MRTKRQVCLSIVILLAVAAVLSGCNPLGIFNGGGGSDSKTKSLIVVDNSNNRVLIYDAPFSTNQSASVALGQSSLTAATFGTTASTMNYATGVAVDKDGNLWVFDEDSNCRVLEFKTPFTTGMAASVVIGKPDFTTANCSAAPTASNISWGDGLAFDGSGNLWVADYGNSRVLEFKPTFSNGMAATLVLGQADMTHGACNQGGAASSSTLCSPRHITFDSSGNLWVADGDNNRLLEFKPPFSNGMVASLELGQPAVTAFTSTGATPVSASSLNVPNGLAFDKSGNLWVADWDNNRVLEFKTPFANGMAATTVLGQAVFTTSTGGAIGSTTLIEPADVAFDSSGNLFVPDMGNNRTLIFAPTFSNGMAATMVIGQADFTHGAENQGGTVGAQTQRTPFAVATSTH